jgi:hypothetical protein
MKQDNTITQVENARGACARSRPQEALMLPRHRLLLLLPLPPPPPPPSLPF